MFFKLITYSENVLTTSKEFFKKSYKKLSHKNRKEIVSVLTCMFYKEPVYHTHTPWSVLVTWWPKEAAELALKAATWVSLTTALFPGATTNAIGREGGIKQQLSVYWCTGSLKEIRDSFIPALPL